MAKLTDIIYKKIIFVINCIKTHFKPCEWLNVTFWAATKYQKFCVMWLYGNTTAWQVTYLVFFFLSNAKVLLPCYRPSDIHHHIFYTIYWSAFLHKCRKLKIIHVKMFQKNLEWQVNGSCLGWYKCRTWPWPRCLTGAGSADTNATI